MGDEATTDTTAPLLFRKLQTLLDEMRRDCIRNVMTGGQYKKIQGLTVRQGSAVAQLHLLLQDEPSGIALKTLANRLQMSVPATSLLVESMVGKGLLSAMRIRTTAARCVSAFLRRGCSFSSWCTASSRLCWRSSPCR